MWTACCDANGTRMISDPKPDRRIRDSSLFRLMHSDPRKQCALSGYTDNLEIHHVLPRSQGGDDVRANLVWLRRDMHRRITANDPVVVNLLGEHIASERLDTVAYLVMKLGPGRAEDWMRRRLLIGEP